VNRGAVLLAGCGDVGIRTGLKLAAQGRKVYGLRRSTGALPSPLLPLVGDLTDAASLGDLPEDISDVIFLPAPGQRDEAAYRGLFLDGLRHLIEALDGRRLQRLLFVSSSAVYGEHGGAWIDEESPCRPLAFNGHLLLQAEHWLEQTLPQAVVARCSGIYGPGRTRLVDQVLAGTARLPAGAPEFSNRIHVDDVAGALAHLLALPQPQRCYVLSDDCPASLAEVQGWLADQLGLPPPLPETAAGERAVGNKRLSNRRLRESGYTLQYADFRNGYGTILARVRRSPD
jgi:nucleoside-diphosphate-sugar epimerase